MRYKYLFGPVASRRLGVSLGVDIVPHKTCSMDCVYCECGRTTDLTVKRREYVPARSVIRELSDFLGKKPELDYITFSGSGEPTLNSGIGRIISYLKKNFPAYKVALITNGSMFYDASVRGDALGADLVMPSLDAVSGVNLGRINRPFRGLEGWRIVDGLVRFRRMFKGEIWLEIFIVPGVNDSAGELKLLASAARKIRPDRIQINALDRPGTEKWVVPAGIEKLEKIAKYFGPAAEVIAKPRPSGKKSPRMKKTGSGVLSIIRRRPCTFDELLAATRLSAGELRKQIGVFLKDEKIFTELLPRGRFFRAKK